MRFTRNSKVTVVLANINIICFITFIMAMILLVITAHVSKETAENVMAPTFAVTSASSIITSIIWILSSKLFPPIFDYFVFKEEEEIYFLINCESQIVDNNSLELRDDEIVFYSYGQRVESKYNEDVVEYLKKLGAKFK